MRTREANRSTSYLCDGKVQTDIDDHREEEDVEGSYNQERLLQHQDLIEVIVNLQTTGNLVLKPDHQLYKDEERNG